MTKEERARELARARHARYNNSPKGVARRERYEAAHPERKERWGVLLLFRARNQPPV